MRRRVLRTLLAGVPLALWALPALAQGGGAPAAPLPTRVTVELAGGPVNVFRPDETFGAALDGHDHGWTMSTLTPPIVAAMKTVQAPALSYRLRTELGIEVWHWNPRGHWSDAAHRRGYWVSDDTTSAPIAVSYGYNLPRRGTTIDQGNNDGYSRLDDGDRRTFWKSNPYLDPRYTAGDGAHHEQWVLVDFGRAVPIDALRIVWAEPYATSYEVQYWDGPEQPVDPEALPSGGWRAFPGGTVRAGRGGSEQLRLGEAPARTRWLRLYLRESSHTALPGSSDARDSLGYAIRELYAGVRQDGSIRDEMRHGRARLRQTVTWVSSTDPWHRAQDLDLDTEQPGLDLVVRRGLGNGLPMLVPVGLYYDVPENAVAELRYLKRRGYALRGVELGEEADGQRIRPEDYAALYLRLAGMLRRVDATVPLGGPSLQTLYYGEMAAWHDVPDTLGWVGRFVRYLDRHQARDTWQFFSWEYYPFIDVCHAAAPLVLLTRAYMQGDLARLRRDGLPASVPMFMTEYGFSAYSGPPEVEMAGALMNDDAVAYFLTLGGRTAYIYGYEPADLERAPDCDRWGNNMMFAMGDDGRIAYRTATYHALRLLTTEWTEPGHAEHRLFAAAADAHSPDGHELLSAYPVLRPDGRWAVLLVNKDSLHARSVTLRFRGAGGAESALSGPLEVLRFSSAEYAWHAGGEHGQPLRSRPPTRSVQDAGDVVVPPFSLVVVRGTGPAPPAVTAARPANLGFSHRGGRGARGVTATALSHEGTKSGSLRFLTNLGWEGP